MSIAAEVKTLKDELAALKGAPAPDLSTLQASLDALTEKVDALSTLVGTAAELSPPEMTVSSA